MYYINSTPNESGNYGNPMGQPFSSCIKLPDKLLSDYLAYNGFVKLTINGDTVTSVEPNTEAWEAWKATIPPEPDPLETAKAERIAQSKADLKTYLLEHPLLWTDGEYYAITAEKQQQLASKIMAATMAQTLSTSYMLTWNSTGEVCKEWTLQDPPPPAFAIDAYVTTLVTYQQTQEVAMRDAETLDALRAVSVDYDTVGSTAAGGTDAADS